MQFACTKLVCRLGLQTGLKSLPKPSFASQLVVEFLGPFLMGCLTNFACFVRRLTILLGGACGNPRFNNVYIWVFISIAKCGGHQYAEN